MPYAPGIVVRHGRLVFLSGVTAAVEVSRLATHPRCKLEISAIAMADDR